MPTKEEKPIEFDLPTFLRARQLLVIAAGLAAGAGIVFIVMVLPLMSVAVQTWQDVFAMQTRVASLRVKTADLQQASDGQLIPRTQRINTALSSEKPVLPLLSGVWAAANLGNLQLSNVQLAPGLISTGSGNLSGRSANRTSIGGVESLTLAVRVSGSLDGIQSFLGNIETSLPLTSVEKIELKKRAVSGLSQSAPPIFDADLLLVTYVFTQSVSVTVDETLPKITPAGQTALNELDGYQLSTVPPPTELIGGGLEELFGTGQSQ